MLRFMRYMFILFIMPMIVMAQSANDNLNQALKNIHSMRADFTQKIVDHKGKEIHKSQGSMAIKRPGKFRWETTSPNKQLVIASGKRLWIYDADLEQVVIRGLAKQAGETPALLLSDVNPNFETDYRIKLEKTSSKESQHYLLTPIDSNSMFQAIRMVFQHDALEEMELQDHLGHNTLIKFSNIKLNVPVADAYFYFSPPKNVDIIDETR